MIDGLVWKCGIPWKRMFWTMGLQVVPYFQTNPYHSVAWSRTTVSLKAVHRYASSLHRFAENKHRIWNETVSNSKTKVWLRVVAVLLCLPCYIRFNDVVWWSRQVYKKNIVLSFFLSFYWLKRYFRFKSKNMSNKPPHIYSYDKIPNFDQAYSRWRLRIVPTCAPNPAKFLRKLNTQ